MFRFGFVISFTLVFGVVSIGVNNTTNTRSHKGKELLRDILRDYEKSVRPIEQVDQPLHVYVQLSLQQILNLDEKNQHLQTGTMLTLRWHDDYLMWNPEEYGNITYLPIHSSLIWIPDITAYNKIEPDTTLVDKGIATVFSTGHVTHTQYSLLTTACDIDMTYFPYDEQKCNFSLGSLTSQGNDYIVLEMEKEDPIDRAYFYPNVEWEILDIHGENKNDSMREYVLMQRERYCLCERNVSSS
ncbi:unnamed protein product [Owenia fusiformis]|uniref:Uncharacterized protein n=1 Tax=Owenia fusiformis TaxID=6347 RepID=A0A8J1XVK9_OWEFU|nr:unnamed protein product [Owenia fusiformis]